DGLVGHISEVGLHWSKVTLIIDPSSSVAGRLASSGDTGLVLGNRNKDMIMTMVAPGADVSAAEAVVTAGYRGGLYPGGILIGVVAHVAPAQGALSKTISIQPVVDFSSLEFVTVVTGTKPISNPQGGPSPGAIAGFAGGMAEDFLLNQPKGITALTLTLVGYAVGLLRQYIVSPSPLLPVFLVGLSTTAGFLFFGLVRFLLNQPVGGFG